ncbi:MAG: thioesterase family protein [Pyrinomonadaceae bacterium]
MSRQFSLRLPVRFGDCDPAGFVYYPVLFHYFHVGMEEFFAQRCGMKYAALMAEHRLGFPTVKVQTEFPAPIVYGDEIDLTVAVAAVGNSSVTFDYRIVRVRDEAECARSTQVHVCMNLDTRRAVPIPESLRTAFAAGD